MRAAGSPGARRGTAPAPENQEGYASTLGSHVGIACNACKSSTNQANPIFHWGTLGPGLRGLPKLAYLSARSISAAAAISLLLCNLCEIIVQASYPVPCAFRRRASLTFAAAEPCTPMRGVARGRSPPTTPLGSAFPDGPGAPPEPPNAGALARAELRKRKEDGVSDF